MAPYEEALKGKYPGKTHAKKVVEYIRSKIPNATGVIYVEAKKAKLHEDCDQEEHFRLEPLRILRIDRLICPGPGAFGADRVLPANAAPSST